MAIKIQNACKNCSAVTEEDTCPLCQNPTSKDWNGYIVVVDHNRSELAKKMGLNANGKFALRVR